MKPKLKPLAEQVMVITGASSGIGLITARLAARRGARVMLVARNGEALADIVADLVREGAEVAYAVADVGDRGQLAAAAEQTVARFGRIDTWVNNAGVVIYAGLTELPDHEHERLFRTNYFGVVHGSTIAVGHLRTHGGALITVGSVASDMPSPVMGAYAASKHASKAFTEALRIELEAEGAPIQVTLIKPAGMATPIAQHSANHQAGEAKIPPPVYDPQLVAEAILDCAVRPRRELTVGGLARAQVMFAQHFPALFDRLAPLAIPLLVSRSTPKTPGDNLDAPMKDGAERSNTPAKPFSLYTAAARRPGRAALLIGALAAGWAVRVRLRAA